MPKQAAVSGDTAEPTLRAVVEVHTKQPAALQAVGERRRLAGFLMRQVHAATLVQAVAVARLHDEGLHTELGYETWKEFCAVELQMSDRQVRYLRRIAERFAGLLPEAWSGERKALPESERNSSSAASDAESHHNGSSEDQHALDLGSLGFKKLVMLAEADDVDVSEVMTEGKVVMPDGREMTLDELRAKTVRELGEQFRREKKMLRERAQAAEAERDKALAERDVLQRAVELAEDTYRTGKTLERLYDGQRKNLEETEATLEEARRHFFRFVQLMANARVAPTDPEALRSQLVSLLSECRDFTDRLDVEHQDVLAAHLDFVA